MSNCKIAIIILLATITFFGCNPEKKLAIEFASKASRTNVLVLEPENIFKVNLKTYLLDSIGITNDQNKDSALLANSEYLYGLNDSLFIANYILGYKKSLSGYGVKVFDQNEADVFFSLDSNTHQINIAQIEIEETIYTYRDEALYYDKLYYHDHNLNAIYVNSWFEYSNLESDTSNQEIYFATDLITDIPDGYFEYDIFNSKVRYLYNIDSLERDMLYEFAYRIGSEYARYTFDLLLNNELNTKIPADQRSNTYWRYNPGRNTFYPALDDKFIPMD